MPIFYQLRAALLAACLLSGAPALSQELLIQRTGVSLPSDVLGFARGAEIDFEGQPGPGGTAVHFEMAGKYKATLYAYKLKVDPLPQTIKDASALEERELVVKDILEFARSAEPKAISANSRRSMNSFLTTKNSPGTPVSFDSFIVYPAGMATNSFLFMWVARSQLWKLRVTRVPDSAPDSPVQFAFSLIDTTLKPSN